MVIPFNLNGKDVEIDCEPERRLQSLLRDIHNLRGVHRNCQRGHCGTCSVFMDGEIVPSCLIPAYRARGSRVETIEGFSQTREYLQIEEAFRERGVFLCEVCAPARALTIEGLLRNIVEPTGDDIDRTLAMVRCRCTAYTPLREAVRSVIIKRKALIKERRQQRNG